MQRLVEAGLCGAGLVEIGTPHLIHRYNEALESLGHKPTKLTTFSVDGIGWSPQIAEEIGDYFYLLSGGTNQFGIIVTPDQEKKPIYVPYTSYLRRLLRGYFDRYRKEIVDITTTHALMIDIDPEVTRFTNPKNLLLVDYVVVHSNAGDLIEAATAQKKIVAELAAETHSWFDTDLRLRLAASGKKHGDLRYRTLGIGDYQFNDLHSFYTEGFGGTFVLRARESKLLILCGDKASSDYEDHARNIYAVTSSELPHILMENGWTDIDLNWYGKNLDRLLDLEECLTASLVLESEPDLPYVSLTRARRKMIASKVQNERAAMLEEVEWLMKHFERVRTGRKSELQRLSPELMTLLMRPKGGNAAKHETIALLLSHLRSHDPLELYQADKNRFMREYRTWSQSKKDWAIERILKHYVPTMNQ